LIDWDKVEASTPDERLAMAFDAFELMGVTKLLDPEDVTMLKVPGILTPLSSSPILFLFNPNNNVTDRLSMMTYISEIHRRLH